MSIQIAAFEFALSVVIEMSFRDVAVAESINAFFSEDLACQDGDVTVKDILVIISDEGLHIFAVLNAVQTGLEEAL